MYNIYSSMLSAPHCAWGGALLLPVFRGETLKREGEKNLWDGVIRPSRHGKSCRLPHLQVWFEKLESQKVFRIHSVNVKMVFILLQHQNNTWTKMNRVHLELPLWLVVWKIWCTGLLNAGNDLINVLCWFYIKNIPSFLFNFSYVHPVVHG